MASKSKEKAASIEPPLSNEAIFRAQAEQKEKDARLPLAVKLRKLKELADWALPLEEALKRSGGEA